MHLRSLPAFLLLGSTLILTAGGPLPAQVQGSGPTVAELVRRLPARPLLVLASVDGAATYRELRSALLPIPDSIPADVRGMLFLANLGIRRAAGGAPDRLVEEHAKGPVVLAAVAAPDGSDRRRRDLLLLSGCTTADTRPNLLTMDTQDGIHAVLPVPETPWRTELLTGLAAGEAADPVADLNRLQPPPAGAAFWLDLSRLDNRPSRWLRRERSRGWQRILMGPWLTQLAGTAALQGEWIAEPSAGAPEQPPGGWRIRVRADNTQRFSSGPATAADGEPGRPVLDVTALQGRPRRLPPMPDPRSGLAPLAVVALDRSLASVLREPDTFLNEAGGARVDQVIGTVETFLGGRELLGEVLPMLGEPWTLLGFNDAQGRLPDGADDPESEPPVRLPHMALVVPLRQPEAITPILERGALAFLTVVNVQRRQNGQRPFRYRPIRGDGYGGTTAWLPDWDRPGAPPVEQGLSPTLLIGHGHAVLGTTRLVSEAMLEALGSGRSGETVAGDLVRLYGEPLARLVAANRDALSLQRMLEEGETEAEAQRFVTHLAGICGALETVELGLRPAALGGGEAGGDGPVGDADGSPAPPGIALDLVLRRPR